MNKQQILAADQRSASWVAAEARPEFAETRQDFAGARPEFAEARQEFADCGNLWVSDVLQGLSLAPGVTGTAPRVRRGAPRVRGDTPRVRRGVPKVRRNASRVRRMRKPMGSACFICEFVNLSVC